MIVTFTPAKSGALRQYISADFQCTASGDYEVPDDIGTALCADFPDNFKRAGGQKSGARPDKNRAAKPPSRDK